MKACDRCAGSLAAGVDDQEAIEAYDQAGAARASARFRGVRWPDVAMDRANLCRLFEGVLDERLDVAAIALGEGVDVEHLADRIEEAWRVEEMRVRFAPEGVFVDAAYAVRVVVSCADESGDEPEAGVLATVDGELCLSFTERHHTRPFVDFMGGRVRVLEGDGGSVALEKRIEPFALMVSPELAVEWGLNSSGLD